MLDLAPWFAFIAFIIAMLALDLLVLHRDAHEVSIREAAMWSGVWITMGLAFGLVIWFAEGGGKAGEYYAGYLIEKSLSVDNVFVFILIFSYFAVPPMYQHRVLFWGILGALVMRGAFILAGAALLNTFHWVLYIFGAFLLYTAFKMFTHKDVDLHPDDNPALRILKRVFPITSHYHGQRMFVREHGVLMATPLLAVLVMIETTDLIFAVDSIPAIFAVTRDPYIVFTSNIFAILGLRALYFLLAGVARRFVYLQTGLAFILAFVGVKMLLTDVYHFPIWVSLCVIAAVLAAAIGFSLRAHREMDIAHAPPLSDPFGLITTPAAHESSDGDGGA